jgi:hypothetical protein
MDPVTGKPLYYTSSVEAVDQSVWPESTVTTPEGHKLYTYTNDVAGSVPQGDGAGGIWHVYSGAVVPVSPPAAG